MDKRTDKDGHDIPCFERGYHTEVLKFNLQWHFLLLNTAATYSSLSHSLKPKSCENGSGHYSLLNHPTKSKPAKASGFIRPDTSLYSSLGELSQTKKVSCVCLHTVFEISGN